MSEPIRQGDDWDRAARRWALLAEVSRLFSESLDEATVVCAVVERISVLFCAAAMLSFCEPDGSLRVAAHYHPDPGVVEQHLALLRATPPRAGRGVVGTVAQTGRAMLVTKAEQLTAEQRIYFDATGQRATLSAPMRVRGRMIGVLTAAQLQDSPGPILDLQDLELAQALADQAALAIDNARLYSASERDRVFYHAAFHGVSVGLVFYAPDFRILDANAAFLQLSGRQAVDVIGHLLPDAFPSLLSRDRSVFDALQRGLQGEQISGYEVVFGDGLRRRYWDVSVAAVRDAEQRIVAGVAALKEVTDRVEDRRRLEGLSRELEQRAAELDAVLAADPGAVALIRGPGGVYVFANQGYRSLLPDGQNGVVGRRFADLSPFGGLGPGPDLIEAVRGGSHLQRYDDHPITSASGVVRYYSFHLVPVPAAAEDERGVLLVLWETTPQVEARRRVESLVDEMAARSSELSAIIDSMAEGVFVSNLEGRLTLVNRAGLSMTGISADQALRPYPENTTFANLRYPDGRAIPWREYPLAQALRGEVRTDWEMILRRPDTGEDVLLRVAFSPIHREGEIIGAVAVTSDISELRRLERQREEFLSVASHELRTPVASIKGYAQMLLRAQQRGRLDPERLDQSLGTIDHEVGRLTGLINDLLDVSRIRTGRLTLQPARIDLAQAVDDLLCRFATRLDDRHRLEASFLARPLWVDADLPRLEQILLNVLENAAKYSPAGGAIRVRALAEDGDAVVSVADEGIGIAPEEQAGIFAPYARGRNAAAESFGGLGLGLYISRTLAEQHGGALSVFSEGEGRGTSFSLRLPLTAPPESAA